MFKSRQYDSIGNIETSNGIITTTEGIEKGIFFRFPIREKSYSNLYGHGDRPIESYITSCHNSFLRRIFEYAIGNYRVINEYIPSAMKEEGEYEDWGMMINQVISPIYFIRQFRELTYQQLESEQSHPIQKISSYGYNDLDTECSGYCQKEVTKITFNNGKCITSISRKEYHYSYSHIVEDLLKVIKYSTKPDAPTLVKADE
jgi:hypothetical protein